jgi:protease I
MNAHAKRILKGMVDSGKPVGLLGRGATLLIAAECAAGRSVTGNAVIADAVNQAGGIWKDEAVVVDGTVYSSAGTDALEAFTEAFVEAIALGPIEESEAA